jgi:hypothetical protein
MQKDLTNHPTEVLLEYVPTKSSKNLARWKLEDPPRCILICATWSSCSDSGCCSYAKETSSGEMRRFAAYQPHPPAFNRSSSWATKVSGALWL